MMGGAAVPGVEGIRVRPTGDQVKHRLVFCGDERFHTEKTGDALYHSRTFQESVRNLGFHTVGDPESRHGYDHLEAMKSPRLTTPL